MRARDGTDAGGNMGRVVWGFEREAVETGATRAWELALLTCVGPRALAVVVDEKAGVDEADSDLFDSGIRLSWAEGGRPCSFTLSTTRSGLMSRYLRMTGVIGPVNLSNKTYMSSYFD